MSRWLENNKHLAETAVTPVVDPSTGPVSRPVADPGTGPMRTPGSPESGESGSTPNR